MARILTGTVVSDKMDKTVSVAVTRVKQHPLYRKRYKVTKKFLAHDETNQCRKGDVVQIKETRPLSKRKCWEVEQVLEKAATGMGEEVAL